MLKSKIRRRILKIRQIKNSRNIKISFNKILNLIEKNNLKTKSIGGYFPVNFEVDDIEILKEFEKKKYIIALPVIKKNFDMKFYRWSAKEPMVVNQYGIPEPLQKFSIIPDVLLIPLVSYDKNLNRLGYGGGFYDRLISKLDKKKKF